jgi:hypothetical protein
MSAEFCPVAGTTADMPVVNWAYNLNYFEANKPVSGYPDKLADSPLPVMGGVTVLADMIYKYFGADLSVDAYYYLSPISYLQRIRNPVLLVAATGDMLVPMEQMSREHFRPHDSERFPSGFQRDFDRLTRNERSRITFEELIPEEERFIHLQPPQEKSFEFTYERFKDKEKMPEERPEVLDRIWSKDRQWSLFYLDEGPPAPEAPHTTYFWNTSPDSFVQYYRETTPATDILNVANLERLLDRYRLDLKCLPHLEDGTPVNRLNYGNLEKRDVLQGLLDYASISSSHKTRLAELYETLEEKPFGEELDLDEIHGLLGLQAFAGNPD